MGDVVRLREELAWFDRAPLFGRRVLVTRPAAQAGELVSLLRAAGALAVCAPMIRVVATPGGEGVDAALAGLAGYDALLFTSANAVRAFAERLAAAGREPAQAPRALCVGPATAAAAQGAGFRGVEAPGASSDAESLLAALRGRAAGRRLLFVRGASAREVLPRGLREAGARVDEAVVYRTEPAPADVPALRTALVRGELDALTFTSASAARRFAELLDEPAWRAAAGTAIAAIGAPTAAALRELGLTPAAVAEQAGMPALVEALAEWFERQGGHG